MNPKEALVFFLPMIAMTAQSIGCEKAYKIADELPECAYRDGYVEGIASVEDNL